MYLNKKTLFFLSGRRPMSFRNSTHGKSWEKNIFLYPSNKPFKPPMNVLVINYYSGKCIGDYLRMSDNLKRNLGGFWHFPISFREYY
jgi:hypothetical protein